MRTLEQQVTSRVACIRSLPQNERLIAELRRARMDLGTYDPAQMESVGHTQFQAPDDDDSEDAR